MTTKIKNKLKINENLITIPWENERGKNSKGIK